MGGDSLRAPIQKGPVHQAIDDLVNRPDAPRQALLNDLKTLQPVDDDQTTAYLDLLHRHLPDLPTLFLDYLHDTWYSPSDAKTSPRPLRLHPVRPAFWPLPYHPTEPIIRKGLIKALELAIETNLPLESYWVLGRDHFETLVIQSTQQITRLIMTPPPPPPEEPAYIANSADIWVIKRAPVELYETYETVEGARGPSVVTQLNKTPSWGVSTSGGTR